jgi:hypothetical protein
VTTEQFFTKAEKPVGPVAQVSALWEPKVLYAPDPVHGGAMNPGLGGRLYLYGPELRSTMIGDGSVVVDLYDDTPLASGGQSKMLEKWIIDKDTLKRLVRRDWIGEGYTLFLPWGTYKPEITQVHLMVCYKPLQGMPLYSPSSSLTLAAGNLPPQVASRTVVPAAPQRAAQAPGTQPPPANQGTVAPGNPAPPSSPAPGPVVSQAGYSPPPANNFSPAVPQSPSAQPNQAAGGFSASPAQPPAPAPTGATGGVPPGNPPAPTGGPAFMTPQPAPSGGSATPVQNGVNSNYPRVMWQR